MISLNSVFFNNELKVDLVLWDEVDANKASWICNSSANLESGSGMMSSLSSWKSTERFMFVLGFINQN